MKTYENLKRFPHPGEKVKVSRFTPNERNKNFLWRINQIGTAEHIDPDIFPDDLRFIYVEFEDGACHPFMANEISPA